MFWYFPYNELQPPIWLFSVPAVSRSSIISLSVNVIKEQNLNVAFLLVWTRAKCVTTGWYAKRQ